MAPLTNMLSAQEREVRHGGVSRVYGVWLTVTLVVVTIVFTALVVIVLTAIDGFTSTLGGTTATPLVSAFTRLYVVIMPLLVVFLLGRAWLTIGYTAYLLTNRRLITRHGLIQRTVTQTDIERVQDVQVHQTLMGRVLGYGNVTVETAGTGGALKLMYVPRPDDWAHELYTRSRPGADTVGSLLDPCGT